ncbi:hypothetical protein DT722_04080, partial [Salmonella enterica]|nr:hypothetical protein [Salmonella enterica]
RFFFRHNYTSINILYVLSKFIINMNKYSQNQNNSALVCGGNILLNARNCFLMFRNAKKPDDIVGHGVR